MKRFFLLVTALALLLPGRVSAQTDMPFSMAAGVSLGVMDGAGVNLAFGVIDNLNVRVGYGLIPSFLIKEYGIALPEWGNNPATSTAMTGKLPGNGNLLVDYHPGGKSFKVTAGLFFGSKDFVKVYNTKALPESYQNAGIEYWIDGNTEDKANRYRIQSNEKGIVSAAFETIAVKPFLGIGFGSAIPNNRVGVSFDLGVEYIGSLDLCADARNRKDDLEHLSLTTDGILQTIYKIRGHSREMSYDKYVSYVDKLRDLPILPVARVSVFVKLF
ncbi:MAG: hypothetical protein IKO24_04425 [Bacteroidales bacterium]|nr:hypothetical protein [Bacteroidales bacterium]